MDTLSDSEKKPKSNGYPNNGGGDGGPYSVTVLPKENITYSWSNINVLTQTDQHRNRVVSAFHRFAHGDQPHQRKHILKNG